ncbi:fimbrial protein [Trabulsiella odontotermitis]|uniref:fimbrial protein n=1 Tax=Trabulsiella odontotermitis TaxID=379893 RepID=UPI003ACE5B8E
MKNNAFFVTFCVLLSLPVRAAQLTILSDCFNTIADYTIQTSHELNASDNVAGKVLNDGTRLLGSGPVLEANCRCPDTMHSTDMVTEETWAGSPLQAGVSGYGYLTENIDIDVTGYSDSINSPDGNGLVALAINSYPTPQSSAMSSSIETKLNVNEATANVCSNDTRPDGASATKRQFKWNVIRAAFYIKKPILGEETIPSTLVAQHYNCLYTGSGSCNIASATQVSNIWLSGTFTAPLSCTINAGSTIEVEMGNIISSQFVAKGQPPSGFTLKNVDITYHCDSATPDQSQKIKLTLTADQGVSDADSGLIARMLNRDDLGIRLYDNDNKNVVLDGSVDLPVTLDAQGNGAMHLQAAPVSTTNKRPDPGKFEGNVTVKLDLR